MKQGSRAAGMQGVIGYRGRQSSVSLCNNNKTGAVEGDGRCRQPQHVGQKKRYDDQRVCTYICQLSLPRTVVNMALGAVA